MLRQAAVESMEGSPSAQVANCCRPSHLAPPHWAPRESISLTRPHASGKAGPFSRLGKGRSIFSRVTEFGPAFYELRVTSDDHLQSSSEVHPRGTGPVHRSRPGWSACFRQRRTDTTRLGRRGTGFAKLGDRHRDVPFHVHLTLGDVVTAASGVSQVRSPARPKRWRAGGVGRVASSLWSGRGAAHRSRSRVEQRTATTRLTPQRCWEVPSAPSSARVESRFPIASRWHHPTPPGAVSQGSAHIGTPVWSDPSKLQWCAAVATPHTRPLPARPPCLRLTAPPSPPSRRTMRVSQPFLSAAKKAFRPRGRRSDALSVHSIAGVRDVVGRLPAAGYATTHD